MFYEAEIGLVPKYRNKTWCQIYFSEKAWKNYSVLSQLSLYSSVHVEKLLALQSFLLSSIVNCIIINYGEQESYHI